MLGRAAIWLAVVMLIVGIALGFGVTRWSDRHPRRFHAKAMARHERQVSRQPVLVQNKDWDPFREMDRMQQDIDRSIHRTMQNLRMGSIDIPDLGATGYTSALDVRDRGDHFEVRADLPNADKKDVKVTTEGDREVRVNVTQHQEQKKDADGAQSTWREFGSYDQVVTLPEAADMKDMKVDHQNGELVITIPKAKAS